MLVSSQDISVVNSFTFLLILNSTGNYGCRCNSTFKSTSTCCV